MTLHTSYLGPSQIHDVHLEITSKCNALCPQCSRVYGEKLNPKMPVGELSLEDIQKFFSKAFCSHLKHVYLCGVHGDGAAANSTLSVLNYFRGQGVGQLSLFTNGGLRDEAWWRDLATILKGPKDRVHFSIDGMADTNHIYRRHVNFEKVLRNVRAYLQAGGQANWDYLVFAHNEHQIEEARALSRDLGFADFRIKYTSRFLGDTEKAASQHLGVESRIKESSGAANPRLVVDDLKSRQNLEEYFSTTTICCKTKALGSIYVSFDGRLWPCCWTASNFYHPDPTPKRTNIATLLATYGQDFNSLHHHELTEILSHPWFAGDLATSWTRRFEDGDHPRLRACAQQCGEKYSAVAAQLDPETRATKRL